MFLAFDSLDFFTIVNFFFLLKNCRLTIFQFDSFCVSNVTGIKIESKSCKRTIWNSFWNFFSCRFYTIFSRIGCAPIKSNQGACILAGKLSLLPQSHMFDTWTLLNDFCWKKKRGKCPGFTQNTLDFVQFFKLQHRWLPFDIGKMSTDLDRFCLVLLVFAWFWLILFDSFSILLDFTRFYLILLDFVNKNLQIRLKSNAQWPFAVFSLSFFYNWIFSNLTVATKQIAMR